MQILRVPGLVGKTVPRKIEAEVAFVSEHFLWQVPCPEGGEGGDWTRKRCCIWVDLWKGTNEPEASDSVLVANQARKGWLEWLPVETN